MALSRSSRVNREGSSGGCSGPVIGVAAGLGEAVQLVGDLQLDLLHARDVLELDAALLAGVADDERAAAEEPVDHADLEVDAADPVERDGSTGLGDQPAS